MFSILRSFGINEEITCHLCSIEIPVFVKRKCLVEYCWRKLGEDGTWSEERLLSFHSRTKKCGRTEIRGAKQKELQRKHGSICGFITCHLSRGMAETQKLSGWKVRAVLPAVSRTLKSNALIYGHLNPFCSWMGPSRQG